MPRGDSAQRPRTAAGTDLDRDLNELYTTAPGDFVTRREEVSARAKAAQRPDDARRIHAARRPTLAAWAVGLLLRSRPEESRQFLQLGAALREAHRTLDRDQLRQLSTEQWRVVAALARETAALAAQAGHRLSDPVQRDVESTLRAVLADQAAAARWASGRLEATLTPPSSLPGTGPAPGAAPAGRTRPAAPPPRPVHRTRQDELEQRRRDRADRARRDLQAADRGLAEARDAYASAESASAEARERLRQAEQAVEDADRQLHEAGEARAAAEKTVKETEAAQRAAAGKVAKAERTKAAAARTVEQRGQ